MKETMFKLLTFLAVLLCKTTGLIISLLPLNMSRRFKHYCFAKANLRKGFFGWRIHLKGVFFLCKTNLSVFGIPAKAVPTDVVCE
jgi:hypothetical protein